MSQTPTNKGVFVAIPSPKGKKTVREPSREMSLSPLQSKGTSQALDPNRAEFSFRAVESSPVRSLTNRLSQAKSGEENESMSKGTEASTEMEEPSRTRNASEMESGDESHAAHVLKRPKTQESTESITGGFDNGSPETPVKPKELGQPKNAETPGWLMGEAMARKRARKVWDSATKFLTGNQRCKVCQELGDPVCRVDPSYKNCARCIVKGKTGSCHQAGGTPVSKKTSSEANLEGTPDGSSVANKLKSEPSTPAKKKTSKAAMKKTPRSTNGKSSAEKTAGSYKSETVREQTTVMKTVEADDDVAPPPSNGQNIVDKIAGSSDGVTDDKACKIPQLSAQGKNYAEWKQACLAHFASRGWSHLLCSAEDDSMVQYEASAMLIQSVDPSLILLIVQSGHPANGWAALSDRFASHTALDALELLKSVTKQHADSEGALSKHCEQFEEKWSEMATLCSQPWSKVSTTLKSMFDLDEMKSFFFLATLPASEARFVKHALDHDVTFAQIRSTFQ